MLNSNFCKMFKNRLNLRNVAAIVACLAVTTMFAACDNNNPGDNDDGNDGGKIDTKLVGNWQHSGTNYIYDYFFYKDGSFEYFRRQGSGGGGADGKYRTSNGKIYFSELNSINAIGERTPYDDIVFEYEFGKDNTGEYLLICHLNYLGENRDISSGIMFRKQ